MITGRINSERENTAGNQLYADSKSKDNSSRSLLFEIVSSTFLKFFPELTFEEHEKLFNEILSHQKRGILLQDNFKYFQDICLDQDDYQKLQFLKNNPSVICTIHLGAHRLISRFLELYKVPFSILVSEKAFKELDFHLKGQNPLGYDPDCFLNADSPAVILQMFRRLKKGNSIIFYLDGLSGKERQNEWNKVNFLNQKIYSRCGIVFLSAKAEVPILPILSYFNNPNEVVFQLFDAIYPAKEWLIGQNKVLQHLYDLFLPHIINFPGQWESWLTMHWISEKPETKIVKHIHAEHVHNTYRLNRKYFGLITCHDQCYLLRKSDMMAYPVSQTLYHYLKDSENKNLKREILDVNLFAELLANKVLIPV